MSRGFGSMQRAILEIFEASLVAKLQRWCGWGDTRDYTWLREEVARLQGVWCERRPCPCIDESSGIPNLAHYPHINLYKKGAFTVAFARAMRTLIRRGVLVAITWPDTSRTKEEWRAQVAANGWAVVPIGDLQRIRAVAYVKCSKQV